MEARMDYAAIEDRYNSGVNYKRGVTMVRGLGARLWDDTGREYIDGAGGYGVANVGHCNPAVVRAIEEQARTLITCPEIFHNDKRALLMRRLAEVTPAGLDHVFLCNSGTEANEAAIKFARVATGRTGLVGAMRGFHGRTVGSLSLTWEKQYREPFEPLMPHVKHVPFNNLAALAEVVDDQTAAVLLEVVQGEGGVRPGTEEYVQGARKLCTDRGALLIVDEVQTGFGRTGRMFACEHFDVVPDILSMGKGIAGGVPMGATACTDAVRQSLHPGLHGSTFGGNPLACAASLATLQFMEDTGLPRQAAQKGQYFMDRLRAIRSNAIREIRGLGLMIGVECRQKTQPYLEALMAKGVVALPAGSTVVRFLPPLVIDLEDLDAIAQALAEVLATVEAAA
ncbi:MAG: aspartate aminotransferase family protein [Anaerolineae bacterium]